VALRGQNERVLVLPRSGWQKLILRTIPVPDRPNQLLFNYMAVPAGCEAYEATLATEAVRMSGPIDMEGRISARFSEIMVKGPLPDGTGFNWQSVVTNNTIPTTSVVWSRVQADTLTDSGRCVPTAHRIKGATTIKDYSAFQTALESDRICLTDYRMGYMFEEQVTNKLTDFKNNAHDVWEDQDRRQYIEKAKYKYVAAANLPYTTDSATFPAIPATAPPTQEMLEVFLRKLDRSGAAQAGGAYAMVNGRAIYLALMESELQERIIKTSASTRQDFQWSDSGKGEQAVLRQKMGLDRPYGGAFYMIDDRMPRYDFVNGAYVERPFFEASPTSIGNEAINSQLYNDAQYSLIIFWHPKVVQRLMPGIISTVGAGTKFGPASYIGDGKWLNIPNEVCNPDNTIGFWRSVFMAAYRPMLTKYGICLMVNRCTNVLYSFGNCY
jgi:hypothetical protein